MASPAKPITDESALRTYLAHPSPEAIVSYAAEIFGDAGKAAEWLKTPNAALGLCQPQDLIAMGDPPSLRAVLAALVSIDYGVY